MKQMIQGSFKKIGIDYFFKVPFLGFSSILTPSILIMWIFHVLGINTSHFSFTFNGQSYTGLPLFIAAMLAGPLVSFAFAFSLWPVLLLGLWIYSKFRPVN